MVFFWKIKKFAFYSPKLCRLKRPQPLLDRHAIIFPTLDNHDRRVPFTHIVYWVVFVKSFLGYFIVLFPIRATNIMVYKEKFFCSSIHCSCVKNAVMGY